MTAKSIQPSKTGAKTDKLPVRVQTFIAELLADKDFNLTRAARKAGYKYPSQYSTKLINDPRVRKAVGKALAKRLERIEITGEEVLEHLRQALFLDPLDLFEPVGNGNYVIRDLQDIPIEVRRCITKMKTKQVKRGNKTETYIEVELMNKDQALQAAMKHLGLVEPDQTNVNVNVAAIDLRGLLDEIESNRDNVVDGKVIERIAEGE